jgi:hypothetical protein
VQHNVKVLHTSNAAIRLSDAGLRCLAAPGGRNLNTYAAFAAAVEGRIPAVLRFVAMLGGTRRSMFF